jgi:hypothetical protein
MARTRAGRQPGQRRALLGCLAALTCVVGVVTGLGAAPAEGAVSVPTTTAAASPKSKAQVHAIPKSINARCAKDVTTQLTAWLGTVPDHSVISFPKAACYRIDSTVQLTNRTDLTFEGHGATLRAETPGDQGRRHLVFMGGGGIVVRDLTIRGANSAASATNAPYVADKESQHAFSFQGVNGATLDHVQALGVYGDFVYIGVGRDGRTWSRDVTVKDSTFIGSGRQGISVIAATNVVIDGNTIEGVARSMFDIEPNSARDGAQHVRISNNRTGLANNFFLASKGNGSGMIGDITVSGNLADAATGNVMWVQGSAATTRGPWVVEGNLFRLKNSAHDSGSVGGLYFSRCHDVTVRSNVAMFPPGQDQPAVEIRNTTPVTVEDNVFVNAGDTLYDSRPGA